MSRGKKDCVSSHPGDRGVKPEGGGKELGKRSPNLRPLERAKKKEPQT